MVQRGLEPRTLELLAPRSNQLSYKTNVEKERFELPTFCVQSRRSTPELLPHIDNAEIRTLALKEQRLSRASR